MPDTDDSSLESPTANGPDVTESQPNHQMDSTSKGNIVPTDECRMSKLFFDPSANVVFRTSDNLIYRVHDFYLKAAR